MTDRPNSPRVSVVIATYNRRGYLQEAIDSVLAQTFRDFEIIVVDDGSTDGTADAVARYGTRIRYLRQTNQGESAAYNRGIERARGELVAILNDDDLWLPGKLERQVAYMQAHSDAVMVCSCVTTVDEQGATLQRPLERKLVRPEGVIPFAEVLNPCPINASTVLATRMVLVEAGLFDETLKYGEDWDMWARIALAGPIHYVPEPLVLHRVHPAAQSNLLADPEEADRWLSDCLRAHEKVYQAWPGSQPQLAAHRARALAVDLGKAAMLDYVHDRVDRGAQRFDEAIGLDPLGEWLGETGLAGLIHTWAVRVGSQRGPSEGAAFVRRFFRSPPLAVRRLRISERSVLGGVEAELAFLLHGRGDLKQSRALAVSSMVHDPQLLRNRGLVSIALRGCLGQRPFALLQGLARGGHAGS